MDKRGALYFKLITALSALVLTVYLVSALFAREPDYALQNASFCEVGNGISVSGFVVRSESRLTSTAVTVCTLAEGQRVGGGQAVAQNAYGAITVPQAGYFSHETDGYEALLTPEFLKTASLSDLQALSPEPTEYAFGRLIEGQTWYFAAPAPERVLEVGQAVTLRLSDTQCKAEVIRAEGILLLACTEKLQEITALREQEAEIILQTYSGLRVPKAAVYFEDGDACVYVLQGARVRRKRIEIVYQEEDSVLVSGELFEGAQVIVTQIELTDGMVLK